MPLEVRLQEFCHFLLGAAYGPWQDGSSIESLDDFNYSMDTLDCVTYVEVVLAMACSAPGIDFTELLRKIHYKNGIPNFISRNHFMSIDWIPNNDFLVTDITNHLTDNPKYADTIIDKLNWLKVTKGIKDLPNDVVDEWQPKVASLPYIDTLDLLDNQTIYFDKFPEYSIANIVRPNWNLVKEVGTHLNVSHMGFVFKDHINRTLRFHHASTIFKKVMAVDLCEYMAERIDSPTIRGVNILSINKDYEYAG